MDAFSFSSAVIGRTKLKLMQLCLALTELSCNILSQK